MRENKKKDLLCCVGLVLLLLSAFLILEWASPYFFTQDDNRDMGLPYFSYNEESLLGGELAQYNFRQFLGTPYLALGQTGVLYPLAYLSVWVSRLLLGHVFAAIDVYVIAHLLIGALGMYFLALFFGLDRRACLLGGVSWALCAFVVFVSKSWGIVSGTAAYFPWMLFTMLRLNQKPDVPIFLGVLLARLALMFVGYIQYFITSVLFEGVTVFLFLWTNSVPKGRKVRLLRFVKLFAACYASVFVLSLPMLMPMWHQTTISAQRGAQISFQTFISQRLLLLPMLRGFLVPDLDRLSFAVFIGYVPLLYLFLGGIDKLRVREQGGFPVKWRVFAIPATIALLWASSEWFNRLVYLIPILNRFRWPFKLALFSSFFLILLMTVAFSRIATKKKMTNAQFGIVFAAQVLTMLAYFLAFPICFGTHLDPLPLKEPLAKQLTGGRVFSAGFDVWVPEKGAEPSNFRTAETLGFDYPTLWGVDAFAGYDPLVARRNSDVSLGLNHKSIWPGDKPIPVEYLRKAGVCWYLVPREKTAQYEQELGAYGLIRKWEDDTRTVFFDAQADPLVFWRDGKQTNRVDSRETANTIRAAVQMPKDGQLVFTYLYQSAFVCTVDGNVVPLTELDATHFAANVPAGAHEVIVRYRDPQFVAGVYAAMGFAVLLGVFLAVWAKKQKAARSRAA